ncbi:MAG: hypothetical protein V1911_00330 [Candidatus Micrarchaeota archaeon]
MAFSSRTADSLARKVGWRGELDKASRDLNIKYIKSEAIKGSKKEKYAITLRLPGILEKIKRNKPHLLDIYNPQLRKITRRLAENADADVRVNAVRAAAEMKYHDVVMSRVADESPLVRSEVAHFAFITKNEYMLKRLKNSETELRKRRKADPVVLKTIDVYEERTGKEL